MTLVKGMYVYNVIKLEEQGINTKNIYTYIYHTNTHFLHLMWSGDRQTLLDSWVTLVAHLCIVRTHVRASVFPGNLTASRQACKSACFLNQLASLLDRLITRIVMLLPLLLLPTRSGLFVLIPVVI